jgi:CDP-paratose 2-epimerase
MEELEVVEGENRYKYKDIEGVDENQNLDFHSPYGCSKGAADQYVLDYARIYDLKTVVLRQSCIYGTRQFGIEDQGWVAWFIIATSLGTPLKIYGNGKQVRDVLYIDDLVRCFEMAFDNIDKTTGKAYNIGGGPDNSLSLLELIAQLENLHGNEIEHSFHDWRPGDQPVFICDISKAKNDFGWEPKVSPEEGVKKLFNWVQENKELFQ